MEAKDRPRHGEDALPRGEEDRTIAEALEAVELAPGLTMAEVGLDLCAGDKDLVLISSSDTTPSLEENPGTITVHSPGSQPQLIKGGRGREVAGQDRMSQSYHEIFETQLYRSRETKTQESVDSVDGRGGQMSLHQQQQQQQRPQEQQRLPVHAAEEPGGKTSRDSVTSPGSDDRLGSEHSGSTETGQPVIPQGDVYLRDGRLVCEVDTENTTQYLTSKLVADSIMWQQTFRNDSPSPEDVAVVDQGAAAARLAAHHHTQQDKVPLKRVTSVVDPALVEDVERQARRLATDVDNVIENLACILQSISAITVETVETYRDGVCKTCDAVDDNIKGMYQLMAKWEELNKSMGPAYRLAAQIKDIKKLLDTLELNMSIK